MIEAAGPRAQATDPPVGAVSRWSLDTGCKRLCWACKNRKVMDSLERTCGNDWPPVGLTMIGLVRLKDVADILWHVISHKIPGDFAELGVWRGAPASSPNQF